MVAVLDLHREDFEFGEFFGCSDGLVHGLFDASQRRPAVLGGEDEMVFQHRFGSHVVTALWYHVI